MQYPRLRGRYFTIFCILCGCSGVIWPGGDAIATGKSDPSLPVQTASLESADASELPPMQMTQLPRPNQEALPATPDEFPLSPEALTPIAPLSPAGSPETVTETRPPDAQPDASPSIMVHHIQLETNCHPTDQCAVQPQIDQVIQAYRQRLQEEAIAPDQIEPLLQEIADAITQLYLNEGYITSRAIPADDTLTDEILQIAIIEGQLPERNIIINWSDEIPRPHLERYARQRIALGAGSPLQISQLEDQLRLLRADPLFNPWDGGNVEASLRFSNRPGESELAITLTKADPWQGAVSIDNYSPPSVGSEQFGMSLGYLSLIRPGDTISASYSRSSTGGSNLIGLSYSVPVNPMQGTLLLRSTFDATHVTASEFEALNIEGESQYYEIGFRQPIIRTSRDEFALSLTFGLRRGQTFSFDRIPTPFVVGAEEDGTSRTSVVRFAQEYLRRQPRSSWVLRSQFSLGLDVLDATLNAEPVPDGRFISWLGQVQQVHRLGDRHLLIVSADLQLTPDSLLPSEQFVIGGGESVRGYRQNSRSGDNGFRFSIEDRITLLTNQAGNPILQIAPFADIGTIWNQPDNPNTLPEQTFLAGIGLGFLWQPSSALNIQMSYAYPLIHLDDRGDNFQDQGIYFSLNYHF